MPEMLPKAVTPQRTEKGAEAVGYPQSIPGRRSRFFITCLIIVVVLIGLAIFIGSRGKTKAPPPAGVPVRTTTAVRKTMPVACEFMGRVEPFNALTVVPLVAGRILEIHFREGDEVASGQLLFTIDPDPYRERLNLDEATLAREQAELKLKQYDARRFATLLEKGVVSLSDWENVQTAAVTQEETVHAAQAAVEQARLNLDYCSVHSPISGQTGSFLVNVGAVVEAQKTEMVAINQIKPLYIAFSVPEGMLPAIQKSRQQGQLQVEAWTPESSQGARSGKVTFIDNAVDSATGTIRLKSTFANEDAFFWPGQYVRVNLILERQAQALVVPLSAVQTNPKGSFVFVVQADQTVALRPVKVDRTVGQEMVLRDGITEGEIVVIDGQNKLRAGSKVSPAAPSQTSETPPPVSPAARP